MFGRNDPANFGTVSIAMMTLFCMSTLTWSEVAYVQYHGCNVFEGGALRSVEGMGRRKSSIEALVAWMWIIKMNRKRGVYFRSFWFRTILSFSLAFSGQYLKAPVFFAFFFSNLRRVPRRGLQRKPKRPGFDKHPHGISLRVGVRWPVGSAYLCAAVLHGVYHLDGHGHFELVYWRHCHGHVWLVSVHGRADKESWDKKYLSCAPSNKCFRPFILLYL